MCSSDLFRPLFLLAALLALGSIYVLYAQHVSSTVFSKGFFLVQLSDLCFALGIVLYKKLKALHKEVKDQELYALLFVGASCVTALSTTFFNGWTSLPLLSVKQSLLLVYLGLFASGICFFLWNKATAVVNTGTIAVCNNLKVPLGIAVSLLFFGEKASLLPLFSSSALILLALVLTEKYHKYSASKALSKIGRAHV